MLDFYLYPNSEVLKNLFDIRDGESLDEMEAEYSSLRLSELAEIKLSGQYDSVHLCQMHQFIFQDIYEWAGQ